MKNIKTIELVAPVFGLKKGATLSRLSADDPFEYVSEHVGDGFASKRTLSISESMVSQEIAKAIDWFQPRKTAKELISELESKTKALELDCNEANSKVESLTKELEWHKAVEERIASKRKEFEVKLSDLETKLQNDIMAGETLEWADEAMTVYYNMIDLLKKITA